MPIDNPTHDNQVAATSRAHAVTTSDKVCMFDMDDTLYDYAGQLRRDLELLRSPGEEPLPQNLWSGAAPWLKRRIDLIRSQPRWWLNLPKFQLGWDIYAVAVDIGYEVEILTKGPSSSSNAWSEKAERVWKDFGGRVALNIAGRTKRRTYARVLVDDYPPYVLDWLAHRPRGLVIMPAHDYNAGIEHPNVIRYDGTNIDVVVGAMTRAFQRAPGEPWRED